jgi:hypothetical protein
MRYKRGFYARVQYSAAAMAPRKKRRRSTPEAEHIQQGVSLEDLPLPAAALIYKCLDTQSRTALAAVSRWARGIVMAEARSVQLRVLSTAPRKPLQRLLHNLCTAAEAGRLSLTLHAQGFLDIIDKRVLSKLLAQSPQGGWPSVRELKLEVGTS